MWSLDVHVLSSLIGITLTSNYGLPFKEPSKKGYFVNIL